jgi:peptidoglycan hydrolase-like protein with peptidoglycan-binding domain
VDVDRQGASLLIGGSVVAGAPTHVGHQAAGVAQVAGTDIGLASITTARTMTVTTSSSSSDIKALQYLLTAWGYSTTADGVFGPKTTASVKRFQSAKHLAVDGKPGPITMKTIVPTVAYGHKNKNSVRAVQRLLVKNGYSVAVDGAFGPATKSAVVRFQKAHSLSADGVVGRVTWSYLFTAPSSSPPPSSGGDCSKVKGGVSKSSTVVAASNIRVNKCLASRIVALVAAARKAGLSLYANSSWRDPSEQIALRRQNCGTSYYDVYQKPSYLCHPPTAIPGTSRHERGLAVDFANSSSHSTAVWRWLHAHAASYHLYNLASEPWHWSWDGA